MDEQNESPIRKTLRLYRTTILNKVFLTSTLLKNCCSSELITQKEYEKITKKGVQVQLKVLLSTIDWDVRTFDTFLKILDKERANEWLTKKIREKITQLEREKQKKLLPSKRNDYPFADDLCDELYEGLYPQVFGEETQPKFEHKNLSKGRKLQDIRDCYTEISDCKKMLNAKDGDSLKYSIKKHLKETEKREEILREKVQHETMLQYMDEKYSLLDKISQLKLENKLLESKQKQDIQDEVNQQVRDRLLRINGTQDTDIIPTTGANSENITTLTSRTYPKLYLETESNLSSEHSFSSVSDKSDEYFPVSTRSTKTGVVQNFINYKNCKVYNVKADNVDIENEHYQQQQ